MFLYVPAKTTAQLMPRLPLATVVVTVIGGGVIDRAAEDSAYDTCFIANIRLRLMADPGDLGLIEEFELLGKVVATFVGGFCDVDQEGYACEGD